VIAPGAATLADLRAVMGGARLALDPSWRAACGASVAALQARLATGEALYGVNTGFGKLASVKIAAQELAQLQLNLIRSHAAGTGPFRLSRFVPRQSAELTRNENYWASAVRPQVIEALLALLERWEELGSR